MEWWVLALAVWMFVLTIGAKYPDMSAWDELKRIEKEEGNKMSVIEGYQKELAEVAPLGKVEKWFVGLSGEERHFITSKAVNYPEGKWRAPMWRAAQKNGLDAGISSFRDFISRLTDDPYFLEDYISQVEESKED